MRLCLLARSRGALPRFLRRPAEPDYEGQVRGRIGRTRFQGKVNAHLDIARLENICVPPVGLASEARSTGSAPEQEKSFLQASIQKL
jgi:hypothetical protein